MSTSLTLLNIIIVNYKTWQDCIECCESILASDYPHYRILVVDNASPNDSTLQLLDWARKKSEKEGLKFNFVTDHELKCASDSLFNSKLTLIQSSENLGYATGLNKPLRHLLQFERAQANQAVLLLNPDIIVEPNSLQAMVIKLLQNQKSVVGAMMYDYNAQEELVLCGGAKILKPFGIISNIKSPNDAAKIDYIVGGCLLVTLESFSVIGVMPEFYFAYWEETHWCLLARRKGYIFSVADRAKVFDKISGSFGKGYLSEYLYTRNALIFAKLFYPYWLPTILLFQIVRMIKRITQGRKENLRAIAYGTLDFVFGNTKPKPWIPKDDKI